MQELRKLRHIFRGQFGDEFLRNSPAGRKYGIGREVRRKLNSKWNKTTYITTSRVKHYLRRYAIVK